VEGKKTMEYEIAEQYGWEPPDVIIYPLGGGTGIIGMWKAFEELEEVGLIGTDRPRMIAVQSSGCCPFVRAIERGSYKVEEFKDPSTIANDLCVPKPYSSEVTISVIRKSSGTAISVTDEQILEDMKVLMKEGIYACPEGAATLSGLRILIDQGEVERTDRVLLYNTGSSMKYGGSLERLLTSSQL